ncbi:MAG: DUF1553 domain-containing protein [Verrucomicrobia bacterium]|nr:DUF1553 domain-containing protein [Verrucomicrobiota bacterium]
MYSARQLETAFLITVIVAGCLVVRSSGAELESVRGATNEHWAFKAPVRPQVPSVKKTDWPRNKIDNFILAKLEQNKLVPSPEADRVTLIRRLSFDVLGLPPSPEDVDQFVQDKSSDAYEKLVERLLASPRYGERWARHWLDVVRFAESDGFETNLQRPNAWPYRDYVIRAFNEDKPYDQFVLEQLAGDTLGSDEATAFIVGGPWDRVKSPDIQLTLQQRNDELHDMVSTTGSAFLGLTVGCARCHDHKFDPISQTDYYAMQAIFAGVQHGERVLHTPDYEQRVKAADELRPVLAELSKKLERFESLAQIQASWPSETSAVASDSQSSPATNRFPYLRSPVHPRKNVDRFAPVEAKSVRFTILETTDSEPCIDELEIVSAEEKPRNVALAGKGAKASASGTYAGSDLHKLEHINDGKYGNGRSWISSEQGKGWVQIELPDHVVIDKIIWARDREEKFTDRLATKYKIEVATQTDQWKLVASSDDRRPYKAGAKAQSDYSADGLPAGAAEELQSLLDQIKLIEKQLKQSTDFQQVYAGKFVKPERTYRLFRGDPMQKREAVKPAALSEFGKRIELPEDAPDTERRLALARWIINPQNPLTARVMVNRLWQHHFGEGLVGTPSDFGRNGIKPSNPELLDWLATEFMARGWSLKAMHRLILLSSTYRQSTKPNPHALTIDASNRMLWRFPPLRLEAEPIRDAILSVSGKLDLKMGGPGFDLFEPNDNYVKVYNSKKEFGPADWRRMVYQSKPRMQLDDTFGAFDCPDAGQIAPKRNASTTPLQALNLLNSSFMLQQSGFFAERLKQEAGNDPKAQARRAFWLAFGRESTKSEVAASVKLIKESGLSIFCRALFSANEFLYVF